MTVAALDADTLERLSRLDARGRPVLSVYLDLDPGRFPTPDTRDTQLGSLLDQARREADDLEVDRIQAWLDATVLSGAAPGAPQIACGGRICAGPSSTS